MPILKSNPCSATVHFGLFNTALWSAQVGRFSNNQYWTHSHKAVRHSPAASTDFSVIPVEAGHRSQQALLVATMLKLWCLVVRVLLISGHSVHVPERTNSTAGR